MSDYCVVLVDGSRARLFSLEHPAQPEMESGPNLVEHEDLVNPEGRATEGSMWSDAKTGRNRAAAGGPAHGYDDHRNNHQDEFGRRFARSVAAEVSKFVNAHKVGHVVMVAQSQMLGFLRPEFEGLARSGVKLSEFGKDLIKLSAKELHQHLANNDLLPACRGPRA